MMKSIVRIAAVLVVVLIASATVYAAPPADQPADQPNDEGLATSAAEIAGPVPLWEYMGCHLYSETGHCHDIFRDPDGHLWYCGLCGTTSSVNELSCNRVYGYLGFCMD